MRSHSISFALALVFGQLPFFLLSYHLLASLTFRFIRSQHCLLQGRHDNEQCRGSERRICGRGQARDKLGEEERQAGEMGDERPQYSPFWSENKHSMPTVWWVEWRVHQQPSTMGTLLLTAGAMAGSFGIVTKQTRDKNILNSARVCPGQPRLPNAPDCGPRLLTPDWPQTGQISDIHLILQWCVTVVVTSHACHTACYTRTLRPR